MSFPGFFYFVQGNIFLYNFSAKNKELKENLKFKAVSLEFFNPFSNQNVSFFYDEWFLENR